MGSDNRRSQIYRDPAAQNLVPTAERSPVPSSLNADERRHQPHPAYDSRVGLSDPPRRAWLDDRALRDHVGDSHRTEHSQQYLLTLDSTSRRHVLPEQHTQRLSAYPPHDPALRSYYRSTPHQYPSESRRGRAFEDRTRLYEDTVERAPHTSRHALLEETRGEFTFERDPSVSLHRPYYNPATTSQQSDLLHRAAATRVDASPHRDKRPRLDPFSDRPHHAHNEILHPLSLERSDRADFRQTASGISENDLRQKDDVRRERQSLQHSSSSSSFSQEGAPDSVTGMSALKGAESSRSDAVKRRKRAVLSCTECKQRKIKCDRNVPNCSSCVRRGVAHLCRWGDERDFVTATQSSQVTPSNAALMARIAQLESQVRILQSTASPSDIQSFNNAGKVERVSSKVRTPFKRSSSHSSASIGSNAADPVDFAKSDGLSHAGQVIARSESSEHSSSIMGEDAQEVLRALAQGNSSKRAPPKGPDSRFVNRAAGSFASKFSTSRAEDASSAQKGSQPSEPRVRTADTSGRLFMFDAVTGFVHDWDDEKMHAEVIVMMELLPSRDKTEAIVQFYFREAEPIINALHMPSFLRQFEQFWVDYGRAKRKETQTEKLVMPDLQFAALLLAVIEGACEYMTPGEILASEICSSRNAINAQLTRLSRSSLALLGMDQFVRRPHVCGLQAVIALRHFCFNRDHREEYVVLLRLAMKAAENLGLHRLGSALTDEARWAKRDGAQQSQVRGSEVSQDSLSPAAQRNTIQRWRALVSAKIQNEKDSDSDNEDPETLRQDFNGMWLPRGSHRSLWELKASKRFEDGSRVARETGRKVWFALATLDWQCAAHFDRCYHGNDNMFTTQAPQNIDDADVVDTFDLETAQLVQEEANDDSIPRFLDKIQLGSVPTINSYIPIHIELYHTVRSISDAMNRGDDTFDTVATIEARFRSILSSLPQFFRLDGESEYDVRIHQLHRDRPYLSFQRAVIHEHVHQRLLKLHRLLMSRGYHNAKHIHSTRTCVEAARVVIAILHSLDRVGCRGHKYWVFKSHIFHAVLALQVDLLYLARQPVDQEIEAKRADVILGLKMLHARTGVDGRNPILASSLKVIMALREEERSRRSRDSNSVDGSGLSDPNTYGSSSDRHDSRSPEFSKQPKYREWTRASESTGELAEHLGRRIQETWNTVEPGLLRRKSTNAELLTPVDEIAQRSSSSVDSSSHFPDYTSTADPRSRRCSTEDNSSVVTVGDGPQPAPPIVTITDMKDVVGRTGRDLNPEDTDLDGYLQLLTSYQNPYKIPGGSQQFNVLGDSVFNNETVTKMTFGGDTTKTTISPIVSSAWTSSVKTDRNVLHDETELAAAGAGFTTL